MGFGMNTVQHASAIKNKKKNKKQSPFTDTLFPQSEKHDAKTNRN